MYDLLTIGDIKLDTFIVIPNASVQCSLESKGCKLCIEYGKKIPVDSVRQQIAGSAPNVAIALAKMKQKTAVISVMGKDSTFVQAKAFLQANRVETRYIKINGHPSSFAAVLNFKGESTQLVSHGDATFRLTARHPQSRWIHVAELGGGYEQLYKDLVKRAKQNGVHISLNPGEIQLKERKQELLGLLPYTHVLFLNRREARLLLKTKKNDIKFLASKLHELGPQYVVITDGKKGAYGFDGNKHVKVPMFPGKRKEATGTGDAFSSGFLGALMQKKSYEEALSWGAVNAASVVQYVGPTEGLLTRTQIKKQLKSKPRYKITAVR